MREKNTRPDSGKSEREATETAAFADTTFSEDHCTKGDNKTQGRIEKLLLHGEHNAIQTQTLVELTGLRSARQLQSEIERERLNGAMILSTVRRGGGYFLPDCGERGRQEINDYIRTLTARASNTFRTLRAAKRALKKLDGQQNIEGV